MNPTIRGHHAQRAALRRLLLKDKLPQTMLFAGPSGTGKRMVAHELARTLFCQGADANGESVYGGCGTCAGCKLFASGNTPDYYELNCLEKEVADVDSLRELLRKLNLKAFSGAHRFVIFDNAEYLSLQAANLLLKTFEEPRPGTRFILICANPSKLPQTVLSRCQVWFFDTLTTADIEIILSSRSSAHSSTDEDSDSKENSAPSATLGATELARLADGSLENVHEIEQFAEFWIHAQEQVLRISRGEIALAARFSQELSKEEKEPLRIKIRLLRAFAREQMLKSSGPEDQGRWAVFVTNLLLADRLIFERNLSASYVLQNSFLNLAPGEIFGSFTTQPNNGMVLSSLVV